MTLVLPSEASGAYWLLATNCRPFLGGALSVVRAQCDYLGVWLY